MKINFQMQGEWHTYYYLLNLKTKEIIITHYLLLSNETGKGNRIIYNVINNYVCNFINNLVIIFPLFITNCCGLFIYFLFKARAWKISLSGN